MFTRFTFQLYVATALLCLETFETAIKSHEGFVLWDLLLLLVWKAGFVAPFFLYRSPLYEIRLSNSLRPPSQTTVRVRCFDLNLTISSSFLAGRTR